MSSEVHISSWSVGQLAKRSGVSVRTLHHYYAIGLLSPASVGANGYRHYGRDEQLRLQQILFFREMRLSLADIAAVLDAPDFDRLAALRRQHAHLTIEAARHVRLLATIDRTIAELEGQPNMQNNDLYDGFEPQKQAEYEAYIVGHYGADGRRHLEAGRRLMAAMTSADRATHMAEMDSIEQSLAQALVAGVAPDDPLLDPVLAQHHAWVAAAWGSRPNADAYAGLGDLYASHPDFKSRYEARAAGLARFMRMAIAAYAQRWLSERTGTAPPLKPLWTG